MFPEYFGAQAKLRRFEPLNFHGKSLSLHCKSTGEKNLREFIAQIFEALR